MNEEKLKLIIELAKENPDIDSNKLLKIAFSEDTKPLESVNKTRKTSRKKWSVHDDDTLIRMNKQNYSNSDIAVKLNRTESSISARKTSLLKNGRIPKSEVNSVVSIPYTEEEKNYLKAVFKKYGHPNNVPEEEFNNLAKLLNRTPLAIKTFLYKLKRGYLDAE